MDMTRDLLEDYRIQNTVDFDLLHILKLWVLLNAAMDLLSISLWSIVIMHWKAGHLSLALWVD